MRTKEMLIHAAQHYRKLAAAMEDLEAQGAIDLRFIFTDVVPHVEEDLPNLRGGIACAEDVPCAGRWVRGNLAGFVAGLLFALDITPEELKDFSASYERQT